MDLGQRGAKKEARAEDTMWESMGLTLLRRKRSMKTAEEFARK